MITVGDNGDIHDADKDWNEIVTEDFENMHEFLNIIQQRIAGADPKVQRTFYEPLRQIIFYAYEDATKFNNDQDRGLSTDLMQAFSKPKDDE